MSNHALSLLHQFSLKDTTWSHGIYELGTELLSRNPVISDVRLDGFVSHRIMINVKTISIWKSILLSFDMEQEFCMKKWGIPFLALIQLHYMNTHIKITLENSVKERRINELHRIINAFNKISIRKYDCNFTRWSEGLGRRCATIIRINSLIVHWREWHSKKGPITFESGTRWIITTPLEQILATDLK